MVPRLRPAHPLVLADGSWLVRISAEWGRACGALLPQLLSPFGTRRPKVAKVEYDIYGCRPAPERPDCKSLPRPRIAHSQPLVRWAPWSPCGLGKIGGRGEEVRERVEIILRKSLLQHGPRILAHERSAHVRRPNLGYASYAEAFLGCNRPLAGPYSTGGKRRGEGRVPGGGERAHVAHVHTITHTKSYHAYSVRKQQHEDLTGAPKFAEQQRCCE
jgi:hypothetical protein